MWVIPYQFTKLLHMTPSELNEIWCVGSSSGLMYPKEISPKLLVWLPRNTLLNIFIFLFFCYAYLYSKHHNLDIFHYFEKWFVPFQSRQNKLSFGIYKSLI